MESPWEELEGPRAGTSPARGCGAAVARSRRSSEPHGFAAPDASWFRCQKKGEWETSL